MSGGTGKYTTYAPSLTTAHTLLDKLFKSSDAVKQPPTQGLVGKEADARAALLKIATAPVNAQGVGGVSPSDGQQQGDLNMYPQPVDLNFGASPDVSQVKWTNPGDPANPYAPDISSPGPGLTNGKDKATDPQLSADDLKVALGEGGFTPDDNVKDPSTTGPLIAGANKLGTPGALGKSGG